MSHAVLCTDVFTEGFRSFVCVIHMQGDCEQQRPGSLDLHSHTLVRYQPFPYLPSLLELCAARGAGFGG